MNSLYYKDNIVAIASGTSPAPIGIIRISGPDAGAILQKIFFKKDGGCFAGFQPRRLYFGVFRAAEEILDEGMAVSMPGPHSFTGEDVVELHCHGNPFLIKRLLREILALEHPPVRAAEPGEFSKRSFLNGKIDLTQAESIHEIITAQTEASLKSSLSNLGGRLQRMIIRLKEDLKRVLALVEARFEFSEEDIEVHQEAEVQGLLDGVIASLTDLKGAFLTSQLQDGVSVVLVGPPNVGKSSLFNAILIEDRAIVTDVAGTTRDVIEGYKVIEGIRFIFRDTAGIRHTHDVIEKEGIQRTQGCMERADIIIALIDHVNQIQEGEALRQEFPHKGFLTVLNKVDLLFDNLAEGGVEEMEGLRQRYGIDLCISTKTGFGLPGLETALTQLVQAIKSVHYSVQNNVQINVNERQHTSIDNCLKNLLNIKLLKEKHQLNEEIFCEEIRNSILFLEEITGEISSDEILGEIFKRFCIGK